MKRSKILLGILLVCSVQSHAGVYKVMVRSTVGGDQDVINIETASVSATPLGWHEFFESDCVANYTGLNSYSTLTEWIDARAITCNDQVTTNLPNISDLTELKDKFIVGDSNYYYNTTDLNAFAGLKTASYLTDLYIKGEGAHFKDLNNSGNITLNLNESGVNKIIADNIMNSNLDIQGNAITKSTVNEIILDTNPAGNGYIPYEINNIKGQTKLSTTSNSGYGIIYLDNSEMGDITIDRSFDGVTATYTDNNKVQLQLTDSVFKNLITSDLESLNVEQTFPSGLTESDSFYNIENMSFDNVNLNSVKFYDLKDINTLSATDFAVSYLYLEDGQDITDGIYFNNYNSNLGQFAGFTINNYRNINNIELKNIEAINSGRVEINLIGDIQTIVTENTVIGNQIFTATNIDSIDMKNASEAGSISVTATDSINQISLDNVSNGSKIFTATNIGTINWTSTDETLSSTSSRIYVNGTVGTFNIDKKVITALEVDTVSNLNINNLQKMEGDLTVNNNVENISITATTDFEKLNIILPTTPTSLNITNNNSTNKIWLSPSSYTIFDNPSSLANTNGVQLRLMDYSGTTPFSTKLSSSSLFCQNYGVTNTVINSAYTEIAKSEICN